MSLGFHTNLEIAKVASVCCRAVYLPHSVDPTGQEHHPGREPCNWWHVVQCGLGAPSGSGVQQRPHPATVPLWWCSQVEQFIPRLAITSTTTQRPHLTRTVGKGGQDGCFWLRASFCLLCIIFIEGVPHPFPLTSLYHVWLWSLGAAFRKNMVDFANLCNGEPRLRSCRVRRKRAWCWCQDRWG